MIKNPIAELLIDGREKQYAQDIGHIVIAWNMLQSAMFLWFRSITGLKFNVAKELWECGASDKQQRNMLRTLSSQIEEENIRTEFIWILNKTDDLSQYRNSLIHTPMLIDFETLDVEVFDEVTKINHAERVKLIRNKRLFGRLKQDIENIEQYFLTIRSIKYKGSDHTWPDRPQLLAFPEMNGEATKKTHSHN